MEYLVHIIRIEGDRLEAAVPVLFRALNYPKEVSELQNIAWAAAVEDGELTSKDVGDYKFNVISKS